MENAPVPPNADKPAERPEDIVVPTRCTSCGSTHLTRDYERGELVCDECGLVLEESMIDQGPDWRAFDAEQGEKRARTGAPTTLTIHDKGLSTEIGWKNRDPYGKSIPTRNRAQLYRLRKWQRRIRVSNATERNLAFALAELDRIASGMALPRNVRETAAMIYRKAVNRNLIRGRSIEGVVAASLYGSCRAVQCSEDARRDRLQVPDRSEGDRPHVPVHDPRAPSQAHADATAGLHPAVLFRAQAEGRDPDPGERDPEGSDRARADQRSGSDRRGRCRDLHFERAMR